LNPLSLSLLLAAAGIALTHTLLGPDHYLPFIMLARARKWSRRRTAIITMLCGLGHVASSLLLGGIGIALGLAVSRMESLESGRGSLAAWGLAAFGLAYAAWGIRKGIRRSRGLEAHTHQDHVHVHKGGGHDHQHAQAQHSVDATFWTLFAIFVLGPCEPLIPLFILPASRGDWLLAAATAMVFAVVTVITMVGVTMLGLAGLRPVVLAPLARWDHAMAGSVIALSGLAIVYLGL
jgi:nickel/cobalt exporter